MSATTFILVYASAARTLFTNAQLLDLLTVARVRNAAVNVTGLLLHQDGNFLQALEGPEEAVRNTYARIQRDTRHRGVIILMEEYVPTRLFSEWSMAFEDAHRLDSSRHPGLSMFLQAPEVLRHTKPEHEDVITFLHTFRDQLL